MDMQTFWQGLERIADEFNIGKHPLVQLVHDGKATKQQLKQFAIEHYEMTVRDSGPYIANGYINMCKLDAHGAELMAENFAEEAMGLYTHTGGHAALLFEFWEKGLGLPRKELEKSSASRSPHDECVLLAAGDPEGQVLGCFGSAGRRLLARL